MLELESENEDTSLLEFFRRWKEICDAVQTRNVTFNENYTFNPVRALEYIDVKVTYSFDYSWYAYAPAALDRIEPVSMFVLDETDE